MRVIVCGAGQVGYGIADRLARENNDVSVIDTSTQLIQKIRDQLDVRGYIGHASHPDMLKAAGAEDAEMLIAVARYDEINMVACQIAHSIFEVPTKIARIRAQTYLSPEFGHLFSSHNMPIDVVISPETEVGKMVVRRVALPGADDVVKFANDKISVISIECLEDCPVINVSLNQLSELFPDLDAVVVGVKRGQKIFVPKSNDEMYAGDVAYVVVKTEKVQRTLTIFGHEEQEANRIIFAGAGNVASYVAREIGQQNDNIRIKMIEADSERARIAADQLTKAVVLNGSALDQKLLTEVDVQNADLMVALTNNDQVNILASVMAKKMGCKANLTLLNNEDYFEFTKTLGIDAYINPGAVTVSKVLQHVRRGLIHQVYSVEDGDAEIIEGEVFETSLLVGTPLKDVELPDGIRIGAINRKGEIIIPDGQVRIQARDRIITFAVREQVKQIELMFSVRPEYF